MGKDLERLKAEGTVQEREDWEFPGGPGLKTPPSNTGSAVPSLMRELRSHMPQSMAKNKYIKPV